MKAIVPRYARHLIETGQAGYFARYAGEIVPHERQTVVLVRARLVDPHPNPGVVTFRWFLVRDWDVLVTPVRAVMPKDRGGPNVRTYAPPNGVFDVRINSPAVRRMIEEEEAADEIAPLPRTPEEAVAALRPGDPCRVGNFYDPGRYIGAGVGFALTSNGRYGRVLTAFPPNGEEYRAKLPTDRAVEEMLRVREALRFGPSDPLPPSSASA